MTKKEKEQIAVVADGNQAPYGIGEIMTTFSATKTGYKKACQLAARYYNRPRILVPPTLAKELGLED